MLLLVGFLVMGLAHTPADKVRGIRKEEEEEGGDDDDYCEEKDITYQTFHYIARRSYSSMNNSDSCNKTGNIDVHLLLIRHQESM